jgi:plastocyanin
MTIRRIELTKVLGLQKTHPALFIGPTLLVLMSGILAVSTLSGAQRETTYLPDPATSKVVSVTRAGSAEEGFTILTQAVAIKETGPKETVDKFGEVYTFSPSFIAVHKDKPTMISFRNLQPDDEHDFMLVDPNFNVLMRVALPPLKEVSYVFTFHRQGLFKFYCTFHQPDMSGQILVLP